VQKTFVTPVAFGVPDINPLVEFRLNPNGSGVGVAL
jgi:hypothetical protein